MKLKRTLAMFLAITMLAGMLPTSVFADNGETVPEETEVLVTAVPETEEAGSPQLVITWNPGTVMTSDGTAVLYAGASYTGDESVALTYAWQYCVTEDDLTAWDANPNDPKYSWYGVGGVPFVTAYPYEGTLSLFGKPESFENLYFRCAVSAGEAIAVTSVGHVCAAVQADTLLADACTYDHTDLNNLLYVKHVNSSCDVLAHDEYTCKYCGETIIINEAGAEYFHTYDYNVKSCTPGVTYKVCSLCGHTEIGGTHGDQTYFDPDAHYYENGKCIACGQDDPNGHTHTYGGDWVTVTEPTCCAAGEKRQYCTVEGCDEYRSEPIAATGNHIYGDWENVTPATCCADGEKKRTCTTEGCGAVDTDTIPATGEHNFGNWTVTTDPTCCEAGEETGYCLTEGCTATTTRPVGATGNHSYGEWTEYKAASCFAPGEERAYCQNQNCTAFDTREIPATNNHTPTGEWVVYTEPGCGTAGEERMYCTSKDDGCTYYDSREIPPTGNHTWDEGTVVPPTCTEGGYTEYHCKDCEATRRDSETDSLGHSMLPWEVKTPAGCETQGEEIQKCDVCGEIINSRVINPTGHNMGEWTETTPAGCTEDGVKTRSCQNEGCAETETAPIPATGHKKPANDSDITVIAEADCTHPGQIKYICENCHEEITEEIPVDEDAHNWGSWTETKAPTCCEEGEETRECSICHSTETHDIAVNPDAHNWGEWQETAAPTCTDEGEETRYCGNNGCSEHETRPKAALGHEYGEDHLCIRCGHTYEDVEKIHEEIEDLPPIADINTANAEKIKQEIEAIQSEIDDLDADEAEAFEDLYCPEDPEKLEELLARCNEILKTTVYEVTPGVDTFHVAWNDNHRTSDVAKHTSMDDFLTAAGAELSYVIKSADGSVIVKSGTLPLNNAQAAEMEAFGFMYPDLELSDYPAVPVAVSRTHSSDADYEILTNERLPVKYSSTYTDYSTGDSVTDRFVVEYSITMSNPVPDNYIITQPVTADGRATLKNGDELILTKLIDWEADVVWADDGNRSASGGAQNAADSPRPDEQVIKENSKVYVYKSGSGSRNGTEVTADYTYTIYEDEHGSSHMKLEGLPAYDNEGYPLTYYISQTSALPAANADIVPGNCYGYGYLNSGNYASKTNGVYDGGTLFESLYNSYPLTVEKKWVDGGNESNRPNAVLYIWRIAEEYDTDGRINIDTEYAYVVPDVKDITNVPKTGSYDENGCLEVDFASEGVYSFPMYDMYGRRYIYFGIEKGLSNGYELTIDNSTSRYSRTVINEFEGSRYFLVGGTLINSPTEISQPGVSKVFEALSMQNIMDAEHPVEVTFLMQKKVGDGEWENVTAADVIGGLGDSRVNADENHVEVTVSGFTAEDMTDSFSGISVSSYNDEYVKINYRWLETKIVVNGGSAEIDPALWDSEGNYPGYIKLVTGNAQSGPDDTTAVFTAKTEDNVTTNTLVGINQVEPRKYWYDENGNSIADPAIGAANPKYDLSNVSVRFRIYRDDGLSSAQGGGLVDIEGNTVEDIILTAADYVHPETGTDYWSEVLNLPRYDDEGREYRYSLAEAGMTDNLGRAWAQSMQNEVQIVYDEEHGVWVKRTMSVQNNTLTGGGHTIHFDATKLWNDDSDLETRNPVYFRIWRFRDAMGNLLPAPVAMTGDLELNLRNNWFLKKSVAAADITDPNEIDTETGKPKVYLDSAYNYLILESGICVDGNLIPNTTYFGKAATELSSAEMKEIFDTLSGTLNTSFYIGTVGSEASVGENWDGLYYRYANTEAIIDNEVKHFTPSWSSYEFTNTRIGLQNIIFDKTWLAGGEVKGGRFALYLDDGSAEGIKIAEYVITKNAGEGDTFTLSFDPESAHDYTTYFTSDSNSDYSTVKAPVFTYGTDENGNCTAQMYIEGLPKFNYIGRQNTFIIKEIAMISDEDGTEISTESGTAIVDEMQFSVSYANEVEYAPREEHRSGDLYTTEITNALSGSYRLESNKVWRDDQTLKRPDVCFAVRRIAADNDEILGYIDSHNSAAIIDYINAHYSEAEKVGSDCYWNTIINDYWWTCTTDTVAQYNSNGFPYIYFATERVTGSDVYKGYYCNLTVNDAGYRPTNEGIDYSSTEKTPTEQVFGIEITENDKGVLAPAAENFFILADGVNYVLEDGKRHYEDYYSSTAVNRPEDTVTVTGTKLWKLPLGWIIPEDQFPAVTVSLYRSAKALISTADYPNDSVAYANAVIASAELVTTSTEASDKVLDSTSVSAEVEFRYTFPRQGHPELDKYDEWGTLYNYYTLENVEVNGNHNFPYTRIEYTDNDFNITNVYSSEPPFAKINVVKTWDISEIANDLLRIDRLTDLDISDLAPAEITLYGQATDSEGRIIEGSNKPEFGKVTLVPMIPETNDYIDPATGVAYHIEYTDSTNTVIKSISASYAFTQYYNDATGEYDKLPLYWLDNYELWYSLEETPVNGYEVTEKNNEHVEFNYNTQVTEGTKTYTLYSNENLNGADKVVSFDNTYDGDKTNVQFYKTWNDGYVDNDFYRPEELILLINRRSADSNAGTGYVDTYNDGTYSTEKKNFVTLKKSQNGSSVVWTTGGILSDLMKYDPMGNAYTYYVYAECTGATQGTDGVLDFTGATVVRWEDTDRSIGNYTLTGKNNQSFTNTLDTDKTVTVTGSKSWVVNSESLSGISYEEFDRLRAMGVFPRQIQYIVQRKTDNDTSWSTIEATQFARESGGTQYTDANHITQYGNDRVLGRTANIAAADASNYVELLSSSLKWEHLPKTTVNGAVYEYRVVEILHWADGTVSAVMGSDGDKSKNVTLDVTQTNGSGVFDTALENTVETTKVQVGKKWEDGNGYDNTRPDSITVTVQPINNSGSTNFDGIELELEASGNTGTNANIYYSEYFEVADVTEIPIVFGTHTGTAEDTYIVTETLNYTGTDREQYATTYVQTISSDNIVDNGDGTYVLMLVNSFDTLIPPPRKTVNLEAGKVWSGDDAWKDLTRPTVTYQIEYKDRDTGEWIPMTSGDPTKATDISNFSAVETQVTKDVTGTVSGDANRNTVKWDNMYKYWTEPGVDGEAELIYYRVQEVINKTVTTDGRSTWAYGQNQNNGAFNNSVEESFTEADNAYITNTLWTTTVNVKKTWTTAGHTLTSAEINNLIAIDALPHTINFVLEYKNLAGEWGPVPILLGGTENGRFSMSTSVLGANQTNGVLLNYRVPLYDKNGNKVQYRVRELSIVYQSGTVTVDSSLKAGDVTVQNSTERDVTDNIPVFSLNNSYTSGTVSVKKLWYDSNNRDTVRPANVTTTVARDGYTGTLSNTLKGTAAVDNTDIYTYQYMPVYKNGSTTELSEYKFTEDVTNVKAYYTTNYSPENATGHASNSSITATGDGIVTVINEHQALISEATGTKVWVDLDDNYGQRPESVNLTLQWRLTGGSDSSWQNVVHVDSVPSDAYISATQTPNADDGTSVFTTSPVTVTVTENAEGNWQAVWKNLPVRVKGQQVLVEYRAYDEVSGYTFSATTGNGGGVYAHFDTSFTTTNTADTKYTVTKTWADYEYDHLTRPDSITVQLQSRMGSTGSWSDVTNGSVVLNKANNWTYTFEKLSGAYEYRSYEIAMTYGSTTVYCDGASSATAAEYNDKGYVSGYDFEVEQTADTATAISDEITNTPQTATLTISKSWLAENNRDGIDEIQVKIKRDGEIMTDESGTELVWTVKASENWTLTVENLPLYQNGAASRSADTMSVYEVVEVAIDGVSASYTNNSTSLDANADTTTAITNDYVPERASVSATKAWSSDNNDLYKTRPAAIYFKLQYSPDGSSWSDVTYAEIDATTGVYMSNGQRLAGTAAYTTTQPNVSGTNWTRINRNTDGTYGNASWANLPVNIIVNGVSKQAYYRVLEGKLENGSITAVENNGVLYGYMVSYDKTSLQLTENTNSTVKVTNRLITRTLKFEKTWTDDEDYADLVRPDTVVFEIEYSKAGSNSWQPIPSNTSMTAITFTGGKSYIVLDASGSWKKDVSNLPHLDAEGTEYLYRIKEATIKYGTNEAAASGSFGNSGWTGTAGAYDAVVTAVSYNGTYYIASAENTLEVGNISLDKTWLDSNNRDDGRKEVQFQLYREFTKGTETAIQPIGGPVTLNAANSWHYEWTELPARGNFDADEYSSYYVEELNVTDGSWTGKGGVIYTVKTIAADTLEDGDISFEAENTHQPETVGMNAEKYWDGEYENLNVRPESVQFKLQYSVDGGTNWSDFPSANIVAEESQILDKDASQVYMIGTDTVTKNLDESSDWKAAWNNLTAWVMINGVRTEVKYRAAEVTDVKGYISDEYSGAVGTSDSSKDVSLTNTLITGSITVGKKMENGSGETLTLAMLDQAYDMGIIPPTLTVSLYHGNTFLESRTLSYTKGTGYGTVTFTDLPVIDVDGTNVEYRITDTAPTGYEYVTCKADATRVTMQKNENDSYSGTVTLTNSYATASIVAQKVWNDENNRDSIRPESVTYSLVRDGVTIDTQTVTLLSDGTAAVIWTNLPKYKHGSSTELSVYKIVETTVDGYVTSYSAESVTLSSNATVTVTNTHVPKKISVKADKLWTDNNNNYGLRCLSVTLALEWSVDGSTWSRSFDTSSNADGTNVYTSSSLSQTLRKDEENEHATSWGTAVWENLPAYIVYNGESVKVQYRVVETSDTGTQYRVVNGSAVSLKDSDKDSAEPVSYDSPVSNVLDGYTYLEVQKVWEDSNNLYEARPDSITVKLQYRTAGNEEGQWSDATDISDKVFTLELKASDNWAAVRWDNLPANEFEYRAVEVSLNYKDGDNTVSIPVTDGEAGNYIVSSENSDINSEDNEKIADRTVITNTIKTTSLSISKIWSDDCNRDDVRLESVSFVLMKNGEQVGDPVVIEPDGYGIWGTAAWNNLPIYEIKNGALSEIEYTVAEALTEEQAELYTPEWEETGFSFSESETEKTFTEKNTHDIYTFSISATKTWDDNDDPYGLRPSSVELKLQYKDENGDWQDVPEGKPANTTGTEVYTPVSPDVQTLSKTVTETGDVWGTVLWEDLPAYRLVNDGTGLVSELVEYRITETKPASTIYGTISSSDSVTYNGAELVNDELVAETSVENPVNGYTWLEVTKEWINSANKKLPLSITVQLQYRDPESEEGWLPVPNGEASIVPDDWYYCYEGLPEGYEYRAFETELVYEDDEIVLVNDPELASDPVPSVRALALLECSAETEEVLGEDEETVIGYATKLTNRYINPRTGDDSNIGIYAGMAFASMAGIGMYGIVSRRKKEDEAEEG